MTAENRPRHPPVVDVNGRTSGQQLQMLCDRLLVEAVRPISDAELEARSIALDKREREILDRERALRPDAGVAQFCEGLSRSGQIRKEDRSLLQAILSVLGGCSGRVEFCEFGEWRSETAVDMFKDFLRHLPKTAR